MPICSCLPSENRFNEWFPVHKLLNCSEYIWPYWPHLSCWNFLFPSFWQSLSPGFPPNFLLVHRLFSLPDFKYCYSIQFCPHLSVYSLLKWLHSSLWPQLPSISLCLQNFYFQLRLVPWAPVWWSIVVKLLIINSGSSLSVIKCNRKLIKLADKYCSSWERKLRFTYTVLSFKVVDEIWNICMISEVFKTICKTLIYSS